MPGSIRLDERLREPGPRDGQVCRPVTLSPPQIVVGMDIQGERELGAVIHVSTDPTDKECQEARIRIGNLKTLLGFRTLSPIERDSGCEHCVCEATGRLDSCRGSQRFYRGPPLVLRVARDSPPGPSTPLDPNSQLLHHLDRPTPQRKSRRRPWDMGRDLGQRQTAPSEPAGEFDSLATNQRVPSRGKPKQLRGNEVHHGTVCVRSDTPPCHNQGTGCGAAW